ncbi:hypothetical protein JBL43_03770 [Aureibaculum sp. A20]|uniref:Uncharacterized protein n=1 Tax=Aureibaculum flavum TaxID=2795986 RepID=A0ABS0WN23_9FLAO|nr:hypothetical protein [Aureibaculum flavum]MBJ2173339.1 hypothetical protein [Aureibaculum flavum]
MNNSCHIVPTNKKEYITELGKVLVQDYGKKKYYKPKEVEKANRKLKWYDFLDFHCWGMSIFSSHNDFDSYHQESGEICDYVAMKTEMLNGLSISSVANWTEIPNIDIDGSWLDFEDIFDGLLEGIGDFIGGIFDGI